ncbi:hypothetical protein [Jannaschia donghaensis]|uniref:Uncharacterized protein n=1 Tax=Jannaschia donghaensis TaxID=420998 RepID=A0A0M6YQ09_9RHOB|nr:hypothetical protein [Jannaschia donghaensis]CTQ51096.1 hypothetical protein JDO7802_03134 [Jannaschia donghaensis]
MKWRGLVFLLVFAVVYPLLALLTVQIAIWVAWEAVFVPRIQAVETFVLPLLVAGAGGVGGLPLVVLGRWATGSWRVAAAPSAIVVALLLGLAAVAGIPGLERLKPENDVLKILLAFSVAFLAMAACVWVSALYRLLLALRRGDA